MKISRAWPLVCALLSQTYCGTECSDCTLPVLPEYSVCPCGTILYRPQPGLYKTQSVKDISEDCNLGLTPELLSSDRLVKMELSMGLLIVSSADGTNILGMGPIRCNEGTLIYSAPAISNGECIFATARSSKFKLTADNTFTLQYTETRSQFRAETGKTCTPPPSGSCSIAYTLTLKQ